MSKSHGRTALSYADTLASRVLRSSHNMGLTSYDAMDHRTVIGGHHCGTHIHSGIGMAEVVGMTNWDSVRNLCYGSITPNQLQVFEDF
jgi:hypothetical protein